MTRFREDHSRALRQDRAFYSSREHFDRAFPDTFWTAYLDTLPSNEEGRLAWEASRWMMALVAMYQATGDLRYLKHVWRYSQAAMESRDDRRGLLDFRNQSLPAWGSSRYVIGQRRTFLVHSGLILEPILEMLLALRGHLPMLGEATGTKVRFHGQSEREANLTEHRQEHHDTASTEVSVPNGDGKRSGQLQELPATGNIEVAASWAPPESQERLLTDCLEAIDLYEDRFRVGLSQEEGFYLDELSEWEPQPFNGQNIFAYDLQLAYLLSGKEIYRERARAVMQFFANRLQVTEEDGYIWEYVAWPISPDRPIPLDAYVVRKCEEISHGVVTVEPIPKMARLGVVFDRADIERFARTVSRQIYNREYGTFNTVVGCEPAYVPNYIGRLPGWLCVTESDPEAYSILEEFMLAYVDRPDPLYLAYLILFDPDRQR